MVQSLLFQASNQWASRPKDERFLDIEDLRGAVHDRRLKSRGVDLPLDRIKATPTEGGGITLNSEIAPVKPTHWSFSQMAGWIKAPANYLRTLPADKICDLVNYGIEKHRVRDELKFMSVETDGAEANTLQAVTSPTYGRIWDADVVDLVMRINDETGNKFTNPEAYSHEGGGTEPAGLYASDRDVFIFMVDGGSRLDVGERAKLNRGFFAWNSEVGSKTFGLMTFLFNEVCGNHIVWGAQDVNKLVIRHSSGGPNRFDNEAMSALKSYVSSSGQREEETVRKAIDMIVGHNDDEVTEWIKKRGKFTRSEIQEGIATAHREEGDCQTLWQTVQGLTAHARGYEYVDARVNLEERASNLLNHANN